MMSTIRVKLQGQTAECGLACLAMVASHYGQYHDLADLRRRFAVSLKGATLEDLIRYSTQLGFQARPLRLELEEIDELQLPCVLHWDLTHFVVLEKCSRGKVEIIDPAFGRRVMRTSEVSQHFTGVALEITKGINFKKVEESQKIDFSQVTGTISGLYKALFRIFSLALVLEFFAVSSPLLNQLMIDRVFASADRDLLNILIVGSALLLVTQTAIGHLRSWLVLILSQNFGLQWISNIFCHMLRLPASFFEQRQLGDITSRFGAAGTIQGTLTTSAIECVLDGIMAAVAFFMMATYSWKLTVPVVVALLLYALVRAIGYQHYRNAAAERITLTAQERSHFLETIRAIVPLKLFCREDERRARWQNLIVEVQNRDTKTARMNILFASVQSFIFGVEGLVLLWIGGGMVIDGNQSASSALTIGMLFAFIAYKSQFSGRVIALINFGVGLRMLSLHTERLADIVLNETETQEIEQSIPDNDLEHLSPTVEIRNVSFRYADGEPWVFKDANLSVAPGESIALTGPSGAGKTTLVKIMLGLLEPNEGEVRYGGVPVRQLGLANVRRKIGTVMQDDFLLTGTILDNVTFFDTSPDRAHAEHCCKLVNVHEEIVKMPMGYFTLIGDLGSGLSGGQKQRLLLARALYKNPRVLALDEATSHLDVSNEKHINKAVKAQNMTRLIVAHRPETIRSADRIVRVEEGKVFTLSRPLADEIPYHDNLSA